MVLTDQFVWAHLPKTGGDATRVMFQRLSMVKDVVSATDPLKHRPFPVHGPVTRFVNIRCLPSWCLSVYQHAANFGWLLEPPLSITLSQMVCSNFADQWLHFLTRGGTLPVTRFFRQEHLVDDFRNALFPIVGDELNAIVCQRVNVLSQYEHDVERWWAPKEIVEMYRRNPIWARIERRLYA